MNFSRMIWAVEVGGNNDGPTKQINASKKLIFAMHILIKLNSLFILWHSTV